MKLFHPVQIFTFLISVILLVCSILYALIQTQQLKTSSNWVRHTNQSISNLETLVTAISESESVCFGYLLTNNDFFLNSYNHQITLINKDIENIKIIYKDNPSQFKHLNQLILLTTGKTALQDEAIFLKNSDHFSEKELVLKFKLGRLYLERIKYIKEIIENDERKILNKKQESITDDIRFTVCSILFSFTTTLIISIFLYRLLSRYIRAEKKLKSDLEELNENKNKFFSIIGHDLRGPINNILVLSNLVLKEQDEKEKAKLNAMIGISINKINDLLINLLKWASIQMNTIEIVPQIIYPHELAEDTIAVLSEMAETKKIILTNEIKEDTTVWADYEMISTVFRNLISNSIKFTPENGQITIKANHLNHITEIMVKDNGVGMTIEEIDKLFKKENKKSGIGTANKTGSGLGLLICKEFVERNGGTISVESKLNKETIFKFSLPSAQIHSR